MLTLPWSVAHGQRIAVFADSTGGSTCIKVPEVPFLNLFILFEPGGDVNEIQGAEFVLTGFPADWTVLSVTPNPAASLVIGNPFSQAPGITQNHIAFAECQAGTVMLWKAAILAWPQVVDHEIRIDPLPFCPGGHACFGPQVALCDAPIFTILTLPSTTSIVNPDGGCTVSVETRSWGATKQLYRR